MAKDHAFRGERSVALPPAPERIARVGRDIQKIARGTYRGPGLSVPPSQFDPYLRALWRQVEFFQQTIAYTTTPVLILPASNRTYFLVQNLDATANLFLGIGVSSTSTTGLRLEPGTAYEPYAIPQNDIWIAGSAAGSAVMIYAVQ